MADYIPPSPKKPSPPLARPAPPQARPAPPAAKIATTVHSSAVVTEGSGKDARTIFRSRAERNIAHELTPGEPHSVVIAGLEVNIPGPERSFLHTKIIAGTHRPCAVGTEAERAARAECFEEIDKDVAERAAEVQKFYNEMTKKLS